MKTGILAIGVSIALSYAVATSAGELPKEIDYHNMHCYGGEITATKHDDSHMVYTIHITGVSRSQKAEDPIGMLSSQCLGTGSVINKTSTSMGYCEFIDSDGDKFLGTYERTGPTGDWKILSGTGKFTGMTGGGPYDQIRAPRGLMIGTFSGCSDARGTYRLP